MSPYEIPDKGPGEGLPISDSFAPPVYVQVPFCPERCDYCAIPVSISGALVEDYLRALEKEVARILPSMGGRSPFSVYVGGGSPTSLPEAGFGRLLAILAPLLSGAREVTFESRPEALVPEKIPMLGTIGSLRLSLGIEALDREGIESLGRSNSLPGPFPDPVLLFRDLRNRIPANFSMDFICTGKGFSVSRFLSLSQKLLEEGLDHLSVYPLVVEERTVTALRKSRGETEPDLEEVAAENWRKVCRGLAGQGWIRYEVSNFAREKRSACLHNLHLWRGGDYYGLGPGAHQKIKSVRYESVRSIVDYVRMSDEKDAHPFDRRERLTKEEEEIEFLYTRLRLEEGLPLRWLMDRTICDRTVRLIEDLVRSGWVDKIRTESGVLVLSPEGLFRLDGIVSSFLGCFR